MVVGAGCNRAEAWTVVRKPGASGPPVSHDRDVDIERGEMRAEDPAALLHIRFELPPEPLAIAISRAAGLVRMAARLERMDGRSAATICGEFRIR